MKNPSNLKKICSFYVSKYHLVTMILPYIKEKLEQKANFITLLEDDLTENMQTLLTNINFNLKDKEKIEKINWNNIKSLKYKDLEEYINSATNKNKDLYILVSGNSDYIEIMNKNIKKWLDKNTLKVKTLSVINCYEVTQFNNSIKEILDEHDKILNTSGEKEIQDVFTGYIKQERLNNIVND